VPGRRAGSGLRVDDPDVVAQLLLQGADELAERRVVPVPDDDRLVGVLGQPAVAAGQGGAELLLAVGGRPLQEDGGAGVADQVGVVAAEMSRVAFRTVVNALTTEPAPFNASVPLPTVLLPV